MGCLCLYFLFMLLHKIYSVLVMFSILKDIFDKICKLFQTFRYSFSLTKFIWNILSLLQFKNKSTSKNIKLAHKWKFCFLFCHL